MEAVTENETLSLAISMENASLDFGGGAGVFDLNLSLPQGAILGMIGPSGCGKTTTIRLLNGIFGPTSGEVRVFDKTRPNSAKRIKPASAISRSNSSSTPH